MTAEEYLKQKLGVPDNWDKYDYESRLYSFNDILELVEEYHRYESKEPKYGKHYSFPSK